MRFLVRTLSLLPLNGLYALMQTVVYPIAYYVVRYRIKVVRKNLKNSFPDKNDKELKQLEKRFYHYLADLIAEIIHGYRMSDEEWDERVKFLDIDQFSPILTEHKGVIAMLGHLGCWEWLAGFAHSSGLPIGMHVVYMRQKNASADRTMHELREKRHCDPIEIRVLLRHMLRNNEDGKSHLYCILSDQKPPSKDLDCWTTFLNQDVPFITGSEKLAKRLDFPVIYPDVYMTSRGHYEIRVETITTTPNDTEDGYITREYARRLENSVLRRPEIWLWSHNRFKWKKSDQKKNESKQTDKE